MLKPLTLLTALLSTVCYAQDLEMRSDASTATGEDRVTRGGCPQNLTLEILLDNFGSETTWALYDNSGNTTVASGGPYANDIGGTTVIEQLCLQELCYRLEVYDAGGNGLEGGGYVLRDAGNRRIIVGNGLFGSTSAMSSQQRFCLPVSNQGLIQTWCDRTTLLYASSTQVYASVQPNAKAYQFWFFDPHGSYSRRVYLTDPVVVPYNLITSPVPANIDLNVRVRVFIQGGFISPWGRACVIRLNSPNNNREQEVTTENTIQAQDGDLLAYPNPNNGRSIRFHAEDLITESEQGVLNVHDMQGRLMRAQTVLPNDGMVDTMVAFDSPLSPGVYIVGLQVGDIKRTTRLVVE
jgi:hypothetical protein